MNKEAFIKYLKLLCGSILAILLAQILNLQFAYSAGIITLLTIQDTKRATLTIALKRVVIFSIMTIIAAAVFFIMGYTLPAFGIIMIPYLFVCMKLDMKEAIAPIAVLCTHYISAESCSAGMILNEFLILGIGAGIGILLNLFIPDNKIVMRQKLQLIEDKMREILSRMAIGIELHRDGDGPEGCFDEIDAMLKDLKREAKVYSNNHLMSSDDYYYEYVMMRMEQCRYLKQIYQDISSLSMVPEQSKKVADYFREIAAEFHETNNAEKLLEDLDLLYDYFRSDRLPESREEFENRALLFHIIESMRNLVVLKKQFFQAHQEQFS